MLLGNNFFHEWNMTQVKVECYAGMRAEEEPRRFYLNHRKVEVEAIVKRWQTPESRFFAVRGDDGRTCVVEYRRDEGTWHLLTITGR